MSIQEGITEIELVGKLAVNTRVRYGWDVLPLTTRGRVAENLPWCPIGYDTLKNKINIIMYKLVQASILQYNRHLVCRAQ